MTCPRCHRVCDCDQARAEFRETLDRMRVAMRRRAPPILLMGERRETALEAEEKASSEGNAPNGHLLDPSAGVAGFLLRGLEDALGAASAAEWLASLRMIVSQRRDIGPEGHPRRVREVLVVNAEVRNALESCPPEHREATIRELVETHGNTFWAALVPPSDEGWRGCIHWEPRQSSACVDLSEEQKTSGIPSKSTPRPQSQGFES